MREVVIVSAVRTPIGSFFGSLSSVPSTKLGAIAIKEAVNRANIKPEMVDEVIMGNVLPCATGQAPARQAAIFAGLPNSVPAMTINKVCGSGLKAVMLGAQSIMLGDSDIVVAGGMENMTQAPYALPNARTGYRMNDGKIVDVMVKDGLWDVYNDFHMGMAAELCATEHNITRQMQDEYAIMSYKRALEAIEKGYFKDEIVPVEIKDRKGRVTVVSEDEEPKRVKFEKIPNLRPAFKPDGTVTAANASSINDGASAVVLMSREKAEELGIQPMARLVAYSTHAQAPEWFTTAPAGACNKLLDKIGKKASDIDLWEINEAFAVVSIINNRLLGLSTENVNVNGGAVALGHPIGASGARILTTLLYAMKNRDASNGIASLCIGGGEAVAVYVEKM